MLISPSVTPWRARIGNGIVAAAHNPGVRKITYDRYKLHLVDIEQFWLDLIDANENQEQAAVWKSLYKFRTAYGVRNITAVSLHGLLEDFKQFGSSNFHAYQKFNSVNLDPQAPSYSPCDCACKVEHLCAIEYIDFDEYTECMDTSDCGDTSGTTSVIVSMANMFFLTLLTFELLM